MLLRLITCIGMVIFCFKTGHPVAAILLMIGLNPLGLITWPIATIILISNGHTIAGWVPLGVVVFTLIGNAIMGEY